jgi:uroporphyrinogen-III synthase
VTGILAGSRVTLVPATATGRGLAEDFPAGGGRVLIPVGDKASTVLAKGIGNKGWTVAAVADRPTHEALIEALSRSIERTTP